MSISGYLWQLAPETITDLQGDPSFIEEVISQLKEYNEELEPHAKIFLDLSTAWSCLSFLIHRKFKNEQFGFLSSFGEQVGDVDLGQGPARIIQPAVVKQIYDAIAKAQFEDFIRGVSIADIPEAERYPYTAKTPSKEAFEELKLHFDELKGFLAMTNQLRRGLLIYLV